MEQIKQPVESLSFAEILALPFAEKEQRGLLHTPGEIHQQPETWKETLAIIKGLQQNIRDFLQRSGLDGVNNNRVCVSLIGAGTSDYIGRALMPLLKKEWQCHVQVIPSTDLLTEMDEQIASAPAETRHLWISFSRSGDSFEGVKVLEKALENYPQINHFIITCNEKSKMANDIASDNTNVFCLALDEKVNDLGLAMTSSFTNMVVAGQSLAHIFALDEYEPILNVLSQIGTENLPKVAALAHKIAHLDYTRICFLGSGMLKAVGDESALKVLEMSGGHYSVMSETFLGLRHGPLSWLNQGSLVVGFLSNNDDKRQIELDLLEELKKKKAAKTILAILPKANGALLQVADYELIHQLPMWVNDNYRPPIEVLFAQCLGLFASLRQQLKPDAPSTDGKIQRVVSQIRYL